MMPYPTAVFALPHIPAGIRYENRSNPCPAPDPRLLGKFFKTILHKYPIHNLLSKTDDTCSAEHFNFVTPCCIRFKMNSIRPI